jgi:Ca2+-binding EF-hand superfamily protein
MAFLGADPYYVPPHLSDPFTPQELAAFIAIVKEEDGADGDCDGYIGAERVETLIAAAGEKVTAAKCEELVSECDPEKSGNLAFLDVLRIIARFRYRRDPFGGKRSIADELPLPLHVETEYDKPCMQHPDRRQQMEDPTDPTVTIMRMIFNRHDADGSGEIEMHEVRDILTENGVPFDEEELDVVFHRFDLDKSGTLDFEEFTEMMVDLKAEKAIVDKRQVSYDVHPSLASKFTPEELADLKVHFGMFDVDGGGSITDQEIKAVLTDMGLEPTDEQIVNIIREVDKDKSGEIEFGEFVALMHKVNTGAIEVGTSLLAQAVMDNEVSVQGREGELTEYLSRVVVG